MMANTGPRRRRSWCGALVLLVAAGTVMAGLSLSSSPAQAHPMGNFSISHYTGLTVGTRTVDLRYLIDMAEIATFQELQEHDLAPGAAQPALDGYLAMKAESFKSGLHLEVDGQRLVLETLTRDVLFSPGAGGLPTMKLGIVYRANLPAATPSAWRRLQFRDENFQDRPGWKEVVAVPGSGIELTGSSVPEHDRSRQLTDYPTDMLNSPPQTLEARLAFAVERSAVSAGGDVVARPPRPSQRARAGNTPASTPAEAATSSGTVPPTDRAEAAMPSGAVAATDRVELALRPNRQAPSRDALGALMGTRQPGPAVLLFAAVVAATLGAFHALEPGHGKTVVAAYLVGSRGTARHALLLGLIVTASHTIGVYLLGGVTLYASRYALPEQLYPWLGVISGLTVAAVGFVLFLRRYAGHERPHEHDHGGDHHHSHGHSHPHGAEHQHAHDHGHQHEHAHDGHADGHRHHHHRHLPTHGGTVSLRELVALGITGGIVPCPAALVVLLSAVALRRIGFGLFLIVAFSVGLAAVLIAIGILTVHAARLMARFHADGPLVTRWLPLTSSAVITLLGLSIAVQALQSSGLLTLRLG